MKIAICGSMRLSDKMIEMRDKLQEIGHDVIIPSFINEYKNMADVDVIHSESVKNKINNGLIKKYYHKIENSDAILVFNETLNNINGYIGGNTFLEIGFAHVLNKKIFLFNEIPDISFKDEIVAMEPIVIKKDLLKIK